MRDQKWGLIKLIEECAEVQTAAIKIMQFGPYSQWPNETAPNNLECLVNELGDLLAMIEVVRDQIGLVIFEEQLEEAKMRKLKKLDTYLPHED